MMSKNHCNFCDKKISDKETANLQIAIDYKDHGRFRNYILCKDCCRELENSINLAICETRETIHRRQKQNEKENDL